MIIVVINRSLNSVLDAKTTLVIIKKTVYY